MYDLILLLKCCASPQQENCKTPNCQQPREIFKTSRRKTTSQDQTSATHQDWSWQCTPNKLLDSNLPQNKQSKYTDTSWRQDVLQSYRDFTDLNNQPATTWQPSSNIQQQTNWQPSSHQQQHSWAEGIQLLLESSSRNQISLVASQQLVCSTTLHEPSQPQNLQYIVNKH